MRQLVEAGADVLKTDSEGRYSALHYAYASDIDSDAKVAYLLKRGVSSKKATRSSAKVVLHPEFYSKSSLHLAAYHNQADRVRALIDDHGAEVNATDRYGCTALDVAAWAGSAEALKVVLQHPDCRVNATDRLRGHTALHSAAVAGSVEAVKVLVQHPDCLVNATDRRGSTALHLAAEAGHAEVVNVLVQHPDCRVNATQRSDDRTPSPDYIH